MKCEICKKRKATINWADSLMSYTHGYKKMICKECCIKIYEEQIKNLKERIKELKNE